jgi:hypothetical protein
VPPPPPPVDVIEPNTESLPLLPAGPDVVPAIAAPPAPTVTVIGEPAVIAYPVAVLYPPAPPPPPPSQPTPPEPPPATTRYSTVGVAPEGLSIVIPPPDIVNPPIIAIIYLKTLLILN